MKLHMGRTCEHCGEPFAGNVYRVTSEESGVLLLDMAVCYMCYLEAKRLGLQTEQLDLSHAVVN